MKLWVDDMRPAPRGYYWCKTVDMALKFLNDPFIDIEELNLDHDAGDMVRWGGDYIEILNYMEIRHHVYNTNFNFVIKFHSANPVGVQNMIRICQSNHWRYE